MTTINSRAGSIQAIKTGLFRRSKGTLLAILSLAIAVLVPVGVSVAQGPGGGPGGGSGGGTSAGTPGYGNGLVIGSSYAGGDTYIEVICLTSPPLDDDGNPILKVTCGGGCASSCGTAGNIRADMVWDFPDVCFVDGGGPGCSTGSCGQRSTGLGSSVSPYYSARGPGRFHEFSQMEVNSSFSPGHFSTLDSQLQVAADTSHTDILFFDPYAGRSYHFVDGADGDTQDGVFYDLKNQHASKLEMYDGLGSIVSDPALATTAVVFHRNGARQKFELFDDGSGASTAGRLILETSRESRSRTITYKQWTAAELAAAPDRQWQVDTVADESGNVLTLTYDSVQHDGRWCVSQIARNDGATVNYGYANGKLASVTYADGSQATFAYGQDAAEQTATITIYEPLKGVQTRVLHVTNDYETSGGNVNSQPFGVSRRIELSDGTPIWAMIPHNDAAVDQYFFYNGGRQAYRVSGDGTWARYDSWEWGSNGGGGPGTLENFNGVINTTVGLDSGVENTTLEQLQQGLVQGSRDDTQRLKDFDYDANHNISKATYVGDGTWEDYAYNSFGQVTRKRSRTGAVTKYTYDSFGNLLSTETGLEEQGGVDTQTSAHAITYRAYFPTGHANAHMLKTVKDELYDAAQPDLHRTDYEYDTNQRLTKVTDSADVAGGVRPETTYLYDVNGRLESETDPEGRATLYRYDSTGRQNEVIYSDGSSEQKLYDTSGKLVKAKDRVGTVSSYTYDAEDRLIKVVAGSAIDADILDGNPDDTIVTDINQQNIAEYAYVAGSATQHSQIKQNGSVTDYVYDHQNRVVESKMYPRAGKELVSKMHYVNHELLYDEDPYGRRKYYGYRASDGTLIRTVTGTIPGFSLSDFAAVWNLTRDNTPNAQYIIHDAIRDDDGNLTQVIDGRGVETRYEYDSQGRQAKRTEAFGTPVAAITETDYDEAGNVIEVRSPRYFDANDSMGYQKAKETRTYNGRGLKLSHTVAPGTNEAATESYTYDLNGRQASHTDFRGKIWETIEDGCCGHSVASKNPLGHGSIRNTDSAGRVVHSATVSDIADHLNNLLHPVDSKTLAESTTRFDSLGRMVATTTWLIPQSAIDTTNPPIAGLDGVSAADGFTTQYLHDSDLTDGVGLDSSGGISVVKMSSAGTQNISLSYALSKLADTLANGGAGISFDSTAPGAASVVINAEDEISFSITDSAGRTVMSGKLDNDSGTLNDLLTWSMQLHDSVVNVSGFGDCLESRSIDALGESTTSLTDGAGRMIRSVDQLGHATVFTCDNSGNQLSVRDPNGVGEDVTYDELGRSGLITDTAGDTTNSTWDKAGNKVSAIDGKGVSTTFAYDARGRKATQTDRLGGNTSLTYLATGQLASLVDAEGQTTIYTYDDTGQKLTEQYPDHTGGSPGDSTYGIVTFAYDESGRVYRRQDQAGNTITYNYDLAGRLTSKDYRNRVNSPTSTISYSHFFTYDAAGRMLEGYKAYGINKVIFTYDNAGRKATETLKVNVRYYTTTIEYDARGQVAQYTYPDGTLVERDHTDKGELRELTYNGTVIDTRGYDAGGRMTSSVYNNGVSETRSYNNDNTLSTIGYTGAPIGNLSYTWDANKNKTGESIAGTMSGYGFTVPGTGYDSDDRLVTFNRTDGNLDQSWVLSLVGDWSSVTTEGTVQNRTHGPAHELLSADGQNVTTDNRGNITDIPANLRPNGAALALNWDFNNRLSSADTDGDGTADVTYKFDVLGRRMMRIAGGTTTIYASTGDQVIADYQLGAQLDAPTYNYVYGTYIDEPVLRYKPVGSESTYYHRNQQYSVLALTNASGSIVERYAYSSYGEPTITDASGTVLTNSAISNRYTYTGREWDQELELYHYRARMYEPLLGRFLGRDSTGYQDGESLYRAYFVPSALDPTGLVCIECQCHGGSIRDGESYTQWVKVDCRGLASTCCSDACYPGMGWRNKWRVCEQKNPDDDSAEKEYCRAVTEIVVTLIPVPVVGPCGKIGSRCVRKLIIKIRKICRKYKIRPFKGECICPKMDRCTVVEKTETPPCLCTYRCADPPTTRPAVPGIWIPAGRK